MRRLLDTTRLLDFGRWCVCYGYSLRLSTMCSIQDENHSLESMRGKPSLSLKQCMKCDNQACVVIRMNDPMCRECFLSYATHKFRSAFGKSRVVRDHEDVIVAFSGGMASSVMLHLIQEGLSKRAHKKLRFLPTLLFIEESIVLGHNHEGKDHSLEAVLEKMKRAGLAYYIYPIEQVMQLEYKKKVSLAVAGPVSPRIPCLASSDGMDNLDAGMESLSFTVNEAKAKFQATMDNARTLTAKENLVHLLRLKLLHHLAKQHRMNKVLLGDSATRLGSGLLSGVVQGRGAHLPFDMSFADERYKDVTFVRPMREFTSKEIAVYSQLTCLDPVFIPNLSTKASTYSSINRLTEDFLAGLQAEYPNTVNTVFRTGEKFALTHSPSGDSESCCMCQCPIDTDVGLHSALNSIRFSQSLCRNLAERQIGISTNESTSGSSVAANHDTGQLPCGSSNAHERTKGTFSCAKDVGSAVPSGECCGQGDGSCQSQSKGQSLTREQLQPHLCYACMVLFADMNDVSKLPSHISDEASQRQRRAAMKEEIQDFLLEDQDK